MPLFVPASQLNRRHFLQTTGALAASAALPALAAPSPSSKGETLVQQLYGTLTDDQKSAICFDFDHPLRSKVDNNWNIVKQDVGGFLKPDQQDLVKQIFMSLHSEEFAPKAYEQVAHDNGSGLDDCSIALFGQPGSGKFEFVLTGRHVTRRCDGDSVEGQAFGGPIFYGHAARSFNESPKHEDNIFWNQAIVANKVFAALDGKQREQALRTDARKETGTNTVKLYRNAEKHHGLPVSDMSADQKELVRDTLKALLSPFRPEDVEESMKIIDQSGGVDSMRMAFYENMDVGNDQVWDTWQLESSNMVWFFRGDPHVHVWVNIKA